ncbi:4-coumarate--CoA ligase 1 [Orussus abietinus]|uniref:4-coumarate--CoA ligase 1 n=1 Tax=Orussus abietinus TaxID=222816 RepID=UPI000625858A|nr:4-coumarate--CoA ligase 1 [Orussus abietinus]
MAKFARTSQKLLLALENGAKIRGHRRCVSNLPRVKIIDGTSGEKIIPSPYGSIPIPEMPVHEYTWRNYTQYENKIAMECGATGRKYTYAQSRDYSNYVARSLLNMGLKRGDVIAIILPNMPEHGISFLGALEAGLVVTTVNPFYTVGEISRQLISSDAKGVITSVEIANTVLEAASVLKPIKAPVIVVDDGTGPIPEGGIPFQDLIEKGKSLPAVPQYPWSPNSLAALPYSSGTTGLPKGVMLSHMNLVSNIEMMENTIGQEAWNPTTDTFQEVMPTVLPLFHIYGMNSIMLPRLAAGSKLVTLPKFLPELYVSVLDKYKATVLFCAPPIILFLGISPLVKKHHLENVHSVISGAAPIGDGDVRRFYEKFQLDKSKVSFYQGYGLTETSPVTFLEKSSKKFNSIGRPICNSEARLVDPITNKDVKAPRETGELWVRGPHVMLAYYKNEKATREIINEDGWLKTGDLAYYDEEFDFFITDRLKELIKVKGFQVPPAELEALLRTHPDIEEAAVIGVPDERCGEVPRAFVMKKKESKLTEEEIQNFVKKQVAEFKQLRGGVVFVDNIPKNPSGKILRSKLKSEYVK